VTVEEALRCEVFSLKAQLVRCWIKRKEYHTEITRLRAEIRQLKEEKKS
jgi:hypothetical protein